MATTASSLVSVIVPVYDVEKYIDECLESIVSQTYENLEIILVNDASPDESGKKCDQWAQKDERVKVIHKSKNGGLFQARIAGFEEMTGDYFMTVDSDDCIAQEFVEKYLDKAMSASADIVVPDAFTRLYDSGKKERVEFPELYTQSGVLDSLLKNIVRSKEKFGWNVWGKIYKAEIYKQSRKHLSSINGNINAGEDILFSLVFAYSARKAVYVRGFTGYIYRQNSQSIMHNVKHESFIHKIDSITSVIFYTQQFLTEVGLLGKFRNEMSIFKDYLISDNVWAIKNEYTYINAELQQQIQNLQQHNAELQQQIQNLQQHNAELQKQIQSLEDSKAYRIGRAISLPYVKIKNLLNRKS